MKIRIDMQGVQTDSRHRGIGRYCFAITREFLELGRGQHDVELLFNAALDGIDEAIEIFKDVDTHVGRRAVGPIRNTASDNRANDGRRQAAERVFAHALDVGQPDVVWLSSVVEGFADDALAPHATLDAFTVATIYDLIPLHDPEYLGHARARDWYMRRIDVLKRCDLLLAISEWVRDDVIERLGVDPQRVVAIGAGVDPRFAPPEIHTDQTPYLRERFGITRSFVMYNGGFDKRKNVASLIEAYAALPKSLRDKHVLVLVGRVTPLLSERFAETMATLHLRPTDVIFTGFVSDEDLVRLYQSCALFVFPSEREGFGLAPLEAMACGAPTLVNNATSLPEVVGTPEALFSADKPGAMVASIEAALSDLDLTARLRSSGIARAAHFSWHAVAARALAAIESCLHESGIQRSNRVLEVPPVLPLYEVDTGNVDNTLPVLRQLPGTVVWSGPLPEAGPTRASDRFRLGGYSRLCDAGTGADWIALLERDAIGVLTGGPLPDDVLQTHLSRLHRQHPIARQRAVEVSIAGSIAPMLTDDDLARAADALERSKPGMDIRWLVDVTHIAAKDLGTGVHRVVRSILREWLIHPPAGVRIEPIVFRGGRFHHAHDYACDLIDVQLPDSLPDDLVAITGNEVYVGLDWTMESLPSSIALLRTWRRAGVPIHFIVYDLLPLTMPDAFHPQIRGRFATWIEAVAHVADHLHCISRSTADELLRWLAAHASHTTPKVSSFPLGVEFGQKAKPALLDIELDTAMAARPSLLLVGTLEPRKGHAQVLEAVDLLWESTEDLNLVIVGHRGWLVRDLIEQLEKHTERNRRLFWLDDADDSTLEAIYEKATVLLAASKGEGFGLPIIEAAYRGKPVIARALPVFREVAGDYPTYFSDDSASSLATLLARWLRARPPTGTHPKWASWRESAAALGESVLAASQKR